MCPNLWEKYLVSLSPLLHCHPHYSEVGNLSHDAVQHEHAFSCLEFIGAQTPVFLQQGSPWQQKNSCVILSTCMTVILGKPYRYVSSLTAQFAVPNTTGVFLVHQAEKKFGPTPFPPSCRFENRTLRSYCRLPSVANVLGGIL